MTGPEKRLWSKLKAHRMCGVHFRRQGPIGDYIADFAAHSLKLIVEVDGDQHASERGLRRDAKRDEWLATQGYRVLRFSNWQVMNEFESVLLTIEACANGELPLPALPLNGGGSAVAPSPAKPERNV